VLVETFAEERARFDKLVASPDEVEALGRELREAAAGLRTLARSGAGGLGGMAAGPGVAGTDLRNPEPAGGGWVEAAHAPGEGGRRPTTTA
jgi:hypothetical protein